MAGVSMEFEIGGQDVRTFLSTRIQPLTDEVLATLVAELPVYARLPGELLQGDVRRVVEGAIRLFVTAIENDGRPDEDALDELIASAVRRAEEGVPFEMVLAAYHRGVRVCADAVLTGAADRDIDAVTATLRAAMNFLEQIATAVAAGYARHSRTSLAEQAASSQLLVNALLEGGDLAETTRRTGTALPPSYLVVSMVSAAHPDEHDDSVDQVVAGRRKLRRLREELDRHYSDTVLWVPATDGGIALIPHGSGPEATDQAEWARLARVIADVRRAAGADVHAAVEVAAPADVPVAAALTREVMEVVLALGRPAGVYRLADVALEYQLTRGSQAQPLLAALLEPLSDHPDLSETLRTYLANDLNRRRTGTLLHVHPNTVDNRLRRIASLTGLDPTKPADLPTIQAALLSR